MQAVEAERTVQEISWTFARTADATEFDDIFRNDIHLIHRTDDLVRDGIVSATLAECAWVSAVIIFGKTDQVYIGSRAGHGKWLRHGEVAPFALYLLSS